MYCRKYPILLLQRSFPIFRVVAGQYYNKKSSRSHSTL